MRVKLEEVCKRIYAGGDVPKDRYSEKKTEEYNVPIFANAEKDEGLYGYTDKAREKELSITVAARGTIGYTAIRREPFLPVVRLITVVPDLSKVSERYLFYALKNCKPQSSGTSIPQLTVPDIKKNTLNLLDIIEQESIADRLDRLNEIINLRREEISKFDELIKARFVEMFGDQEANPKGWVKCTVGDCCALKSGTSIPADKENEGGPIPYVKVGDMNYPGNERYITTSSRFVSAETAGKGLFEVGSILFPKRGGAIGTNKKRMTVLPICADLNVMGVSSNGKHLPEYLLTYFDMIDLDSLSDGSSVPQINNKNIAPLEICIPPMGLQRQFAAFVAQVDKSKIVA